MPTGKFPQARGRPARVRNLPVDLEKTTTDSSDEDWDWFCDPSENYTQGKWWVFTDREGINEGGRSFQNESNPRVKIWNERTSFPFSETGRKSLFDYVDRFIKENPKEACRVEEFVMGSAQDEDDDDYSIIYDRLSKHRSGK